MNCHHTFLVVLIHNWYYQTEGWTNCYFKQQNHIMWIWLPKHETQLSSILSAVFTPLLSLTLTSAASRSPTALIRPSLAATCRGTIWCGEKVQVRGQMTSRRSEYRLASFPGSCTWVVERKKWSDKHSGRHADFTHDACNWPRCVDDDRGSKDLSIYLPIYLSIYLITQTIEHVVDYK